MVGWDGEYGTGRLNHIVISHNHINLDMSYETN